MAIDQKKKGILISFFRSTNLGDLVLADCLFALVNAELPVRKLCFGREPFAFSEVNAFSPTKASLKRRIYGMGLTCLNKIGLRKISDHIVSVRAHNRSSSSHLFEQLREVFAETDLVFIGGGNLLFSLRAQDNTTFDYVRIYVELAREYKKRVIFLSIGIGPFASKSHEEQAVEILQSAWAVTFRDQFSLDLYCELAPNAHNGYLSADPALLLTKRIARIRSDHEIHTVALNFIGLRVLPLVDAERARVLEGYKALTAALCSRYRVLLFSTDLADYEDLLTVASASECHEAELYQITGLGSLLELYKAVDYLIAGRMHALIIACTQGIPYIGLNWQRKVQSFMEWTRSTEWIFPFDSLARDSAAIINRARSLQGDLIQLPDDAFERLNINNQIIRTAIFDLENRDGND